MTTNEALTWLQTSMVGHAISHTNHMVGALLQVVHVIGFVMLLASLLLISIRVLGIALAQYPVAVVAREASRLIWVGLAFAAGSGVLMFVSSPKLYYFNAAFRLKLVLLIAAVLTQYFLVRRVCATETPSPVFARVSVALALLFWFSVSMAGRAIAFI